MWMLMAPALSISLTYTDVNMCSRAADEINHISNATVAVCIPYDPQAQMDELSIVLNQFMTVMKGIQNETHIKRND
jgi:hypothetical protein